MGRGPLLSLKVTPDPPELSCSLPHPLLWPLARLTALFIQGLMSAFSLWPFSAAVLGVHLQEGRMGVPVLWKLGERHQDEGLTFPD